MLDLFIFRACVEIESEGEWIVDILQSSMQLSLQFSTQFILDKDRMFPYVSMTVHDECSKIVFGSMFAYKIDL